MLTENFLFSQGSLQDYVDCPRRFQLRYLHNLAWPAIEAEPVEEQEKRIQLGVDFHRMVQRHITGIPKDILEQNLSDENLSRWWRNYMVYRPYDHPGRPYAEITLTIPIARYRLMAKYDLMIVDAGKRIIIMDWKTTQFLPRKTQLQQRMQTRVYRYVCAGAGAHLFGNQSLTPDNVEMIYWFPEYPESPVRLPYNPTQLEADRNVIGNLINEIDALPDADFRLTTDTKRCSYCRYRTYCGTSEHVGRIESFVNESLESLEDDEFDFEHIAEIEF